MYKFFLVIGVTNFASTNVSFMHTHSLGPTVQNLKPKNKPLRMLILKTVNF